MSDLPAGFVVDAPASAGMRPQGLPEGFVLDGAPPAPPEPKKFGLSDTWPAKIAKAIGSAVTLPGDVYHGDAAVPQSSNMGPETTANLGRVFDLAGVATPVNPAVAAGDFAIPGVMRATQPMRNELPAGQGVAQAAERIGVDLPAAVATDVPGVQQLGKVASNVLIAGQPLRKASRDAIEQLGAAAETTQAEFGSGSIPSAGAAAREGLTQYISKTLSERMDKLYGKVDELVNPTVATPLDATKRLALEIEGRRDIATMAPSAAVAKIKEAIDRPEGLTYAGVKELRSSIGELMKGGLLPADISGRELKQIYGALTEDLKTVVANAGGEQAARAFERANTYARLAADRRENLARILNAKSDEAIFDRLAATAGSSTRADLDLLTQARKAVDPEAWNEIASGVISKLGRDKDGNFSPDRFVSGYNSLSDAGKGILFRSTGRRDLAEALDDIAAVSSRFKLLNQYGNPSGTGQTVSGVVGTTGLWAEPMTAIGAFVTTAGLSALLSRTASAERMAQWAKVYESAITKPTAGTARAFKETTQTFALSAARELGLPQKGRDLAEKLTLLIPDYRALEPVKP